MLKQINNDFYNIAHRLKQIDRNYIIFFNTATNLFQVYEIKNNKKIFLFIIGKALNNLALKKAHETSYKNFKKIFKDIEETNRKIDKHNKEHLLNFSKDTLESFLSYADRKNCDVNFNDVYKFKWI